MLFVGWPETLINTLHTFSLIGKCWQFRQAPFIAYPHLVTLWAILFSFLRIADVFCRPRHESPCRKWGPVGPEPILLGPIDTGTAPLCGGPSAKPDCKHKHYELFYVKRYELSIVSQPFLCVVQNQVFIMFRCSVRSNGAVVLHTISTT